MFLPAIESAVATSTTAHPVVHPPQIKPTPTFESLWQKVEPGLREFKFLATEAAKQSVSSQDGVSPRTRKVLKNCFDTLTDSFDLLIGDSADVPNHVRDEVGNRMLEEFLPYVSLTKTTQRFFTKPRGYAGDFFTIEMIYKDQASGYNELGKLLDRFFLDGSPAVAVRNRRRLLAEEIQRTVDGVPGRAANVTSIACGPAREVFDVYETLNDPSDLKATLLDIDEQALEFVSERLAAEQLEDHVCLHEENVVYLAIGRRSLDIEPQDLIYSIGLIDYFNDKTVNRLINYAHRLLRPGGRLILGNFHTCNTGKAFMDHVLQWKLIHRDEADMDRLFRESDFGRPCTNIRFEGEGINMFAECVKQA